MKPFVALGWSPGARSGWGQFGVHFARTCTEAGYRVTIPGLDQSGVMPTDLPDLERLVSTGLPEGDGWLFMPLGNGSGPRPTIDDRPDLKVAGIIFVEDTGSIDAAALNTYDVIVAGSRWTERVLKEKGVERVVLCHQGYDGRVFFPPPEPPMERIQQCEGSSFFERVPIPRRERKPSRPMIFSGGKLEFRKGQDIVVEAFRRFRATPEGKDAVLVTNWQNLWPNTMDGIWLSGYVKGVPVVRNGRADIVGWLEKNGLPRESVIDCGFMSQPEVAQVMRSCTVAVFPNRAESGTNLPLVEALATGIPCVMAGVHGQADSANHYAPVPPWLLQRAGTVPAGCPLYHSTEGWTEPDPEEVVEGLRFTFDTPRQTHYADYWDWSARGPAIVDAVQCDPPARIEQGDSVSIECDECGPVGVEVTRAKR